MRLTSVRFTGLTVAISVAFFSSLLIGSASAQHAVETSPSETGLHALSVSDILKLIVIPLFLLFVSGIIMNAIARYHLIRNLYCEIEQNVDWYCAVAKAFSEWKKGNASRKKIKAPEKLERITWRSYFCESL